MTLTKNRFLRIYKLHHGYLGVINVGNKQFEFGLKVTKPRYFALYLKKNNKYYKTIIKIGAI